MTPAARDMLDALSAAFHGGGLSAVENDPVLFELRVAGLAYPSPFSSPGAIYVRWLITPLGEDARLTPPPPEPTNRTALLGSAIR